MTDSSVGVSTQWKKQTNVSVTEWKKPTNMSIILATECEKPTNISVILMYRIGQSDTMWPYELI